MTQPEAHLVKKIQLYIRKRGGYCAKIHGGDNPFQQVGLPDLLCCWKGRFIGLEVKQPGGRTSPKQRQVLDEIEAAGGITAVVTTVEEVAELLGDL
jgi:VRR-NUC domain